MSQDHTQGAHKLKVDLSLDDETPYPVLETEEQALEAMEKFLIETDRQIVLDQYNLYRESSREDYDYPDLEVWQFYFSRADHLDHVRIEVREVDGECFFDDNDELEREWLDDDQIENEDLLFGDTDEAVLQSRGEALAARRAARAAAPPGVK